MEPRIVNIYKRSNMLFLVPQYGNLPTTPVRSLSNLASLDEKGRLVSMSLGDCTPEADSREVSIRKSTMQDIYNAIGVKDWDELVINCLCVSLFATPNAISFRPRRNDPTYSSFFQNSENITKELDVLSSFTAIGEALNWAFEHATLEASPGEDQED